MCFYVTAILPGNANVAKTREIARLHHLNLDVLHNEHVVGELAPSECQYLTTVGHCDCGTLIGSAVRPESTRHSEKSLAKKEKQLVDQGWSKAKIDRWRSQRQQVKARSDRLRRDRL